jgi:hypothetical protein
VAGCAGEVARPGELRRPDKKEKREGLEVVELAVVGRCGSFCWSLDLRLGERESDVVVRVSVGFCCRRRRRTSSS